MPERQISLNWFDGSDVVKHKAFQIILKPQLVEEENRKIQPPLPATLIEINLFLINAN